MELNLPNGYTLVKTEELHNIEKLSKEYQKFRKIYYSYNKLLNRIFKTTEEILNPLKEEENVK